MWVWLLLFFLPLSSVFLQTKHVQLFWFVCCVAFETKNFIFNVQSITFPVLRCWFLYFCKPQNVFMDVSVSKKIHGWYPEPIRKGRPYSGLTPAPTFTHYKTLLTNRSDLQACSPPLPPKKSATDTTVHAPL